MKKQVLTGTEKEKNTNSYQLLNELDITVRSYDQIIDTDYITSIKEVRTIPIEEDMRNNTPFRYDNNYNVDRHLMCVCTGSVYDRIIGLKIHDDDYNTFMKMLKENDCNIKSVLRTRTDAHFYYYFVFKLTKYQSNKMIDINTVTTRFMKKRTTVYYNNSRVPISGYVINQNNNRSYIKPKEYINPCCLPDFVLYSILYSLKKPVIKEISISATTGQEVPNDNAGLELEDVIQKEEDVAFQKFNARIVEVSQKSGDYVNINHSRAVFKCLCDGSAMAIPRFYKDIYPEYHIYDGSRREWYSMNKHGIYKKDTEELLSARIRMTGDLYNIFSNYMHKFLSTLPNEQKKNEMKRYSKMVSDFPKLSSKKIIVEQLKELFVVKNLFSKMNRNKYLFAFDNGVYDLKTFTFRDASKKDLVFETNGYNYTNSKKEHRKLIKSTIKDMFLTEELYTYFMTIISLRLVRINELEEFYFLIGNASNGKGLVTSLIQETFGNYSQVLESSSFYKTKHGVSASAATPELASTRDSNIVFVNELDRETKLTAAMVKKLSGNDKIKVRFLRQDCFEFIPGYSLFFVSNHEPNIDGDDCGIQRRLKFIPFNVTFKDDPKLPNEKKVNRELKQFFKEKEYCCAFFDVLVSFYKKYMSNNKVIVVPDEVKIKSKKYLDCNDPVKQFVTKCIEITNNDNDIINAKKMMDMFSNYNGGMRGYKPGILKTRLQQDFGIKWKKTASSNVYIGIKDKQQNNDLDI